MAEKVEECSHTPGPWTLNADAHRHEPGFYGTPNEPGEKEVYTAIRIGESGVRLTGYMLPADANLIVASPELYAALNDVLDSFDRQTMEEMLRKDNDAHDDDEFCVNLTAKQLRAINHAILKAEGKV
jgi:hypothetical protein